MLTRSTLGESLRSQLSKASTCNLLLSGELLAEMADNEPATLELLKAALQAERVGLDRRRVPRATRIAVVV